MRAKELGLLDKVEPLLEALRTNAGFWIKESLFEKVLQEMNER